MPTAEPSCLGCYRTVRQYPGTVLVPLGDYDLICTTCKAERPWLQVMCGWCGVEPAKVTGGFPHRNSDKVRGHNLLTIESHWSVDHGCYLPIGRRCDTVRILGKLQSPPVGEATSAAAT